MNKLLLLFAFSLVIFACKNTTDNSTDKEVKAEVKPMNTSPKEEPTAEPASDNYLNPVDFELYCEKQAEPSKETGQDYYKLYVKSASLKEPVFVQNLNACAPVDKKDYRQLQMLANANGAVNGWFAGGGPLIYGYIEDLNEIVLMKFFQEESAMDSHAGHDHSGHDHDGHDHDHGHGADFDYKEFKRIVVNKDGSFAEKAQTR